MVEFTRRTIERPNLFPECFSCKSADKLVSKKARITGNFIAQNGRIFCSPNSSIYPTGHDNTVSMRIRRTIETPTEITTTNTVIKNQTPCPGLEARLKRESGNPVSRFKHLIGSAINFVYKRF